MNKCGLITLDIDGTLTDNSHTIPDAVVDYLCYLYDEGWEVVLLTGRSLSYAKHSFENISFPVYIGVQNGADVIYLDENRNVLQTYIPKTEIDEVLTHLDQDDVEVFVYSGHERGDFCYFRKDGLSREMVRYVDKLQTLSDAPWVPIHSFQDIPQNGVPLIKAVGPKNLLNASDGRLQQMPQIAHSIIADPIFTNTHLCLITHSLATKGNAAQNMKDLLRIDGPHIAAGDDRNDISMLSIADRAIVMETAPHDMHAMGDVVAKPATECGIIDALSTVIQDLNGDVP